MILELDCGNSFIKWRVIHVADAVIEGGGIVDSDQALVAEVAALASVRLTGCRIVSVRSEEETDALCALIAQAFAVQARVAHLSVKWQVCAMAMTTISVWVWIVGWRRWGHFTWPRARAW